MCVSHVCSAELEARSPSATLRGPSLPATHTPHCQDTTHTAATAILSQLTDLLPRIVPALTIKTRLEILPMVQVRVRYHSCHAYTVVNAFACAFLHVLTLCWHVHVHVLASAFAACMALIMRTPGLCLAHRTRARLEILPMVQVRCSSCACRYLHVACSWTHLRCTHKP